LFEKGLVYKNNTQGICPCGKKRRINYVERLDHPAAGLLLHCHILFNSAGCAGYTYAYWAG
jgi:hypothetical protein